MDLNINTKTETNRIVNMIKFYFNQANRKKAIVGISGGLDSACMAALCKQALGKDNVVGIMMPYGEQSDIKDSEELVKLLDIEPYVIDIKPMADSFVIDKISDCRSGNLKARVRMTVLYDMAAMFDGLVVGTSNRTELLLGYFTRHGDGAADLEPIGHLYKTQVRQLAKSLGIPENILTKAPTAGLWEGQTDEAELGGSYEDIDKILSSMNVLDVMRNKAYGLVEIKADSSLYDKLASRMHKNKFKLESAKLLENIFV